MAADGFEQPDGVGISAKRWATCSSWSISRVQRATLGFMGAETWVQTIRGGSVILGGDVIRSRAMPWRLGSVFP